jgi:hypothetical protein
MISTGDLEMNMPFTIHDTIILPEKTIDNWILIHKTQDKTPISVIETLIHEKVHIIQRMNQDKFNEFYKQYYPFAKAYKGGIPTELLKHYMNNPDSNGNLWTYNFKNQTYLPLLVVENGSLQQIGYNIKNNNDKIRLSDEFMESNNIKSDYSVYHLNELFAYQLTDDIINNKRNPERYNFIKNI